VTDREGCNRWHNNKLRIRTPFFPSTMQSNFFCNWSKISVLGFFPKTPNSFYNNTEIHWHVVKWPPSSHLKALSEYHACEDWEKGGKGKPCIRRHCQSWGRTWRRRWCRPLSRHHRHGWDRHHSKCQHRGTACNLACHSVCCFVLLKRKFQMTSLFARRRTECSLGSVHAKTAEHIPKLILCFFIN
jgi:hypothetical protein